MTRRVVAVVVVVISRSGSTYGKAKSVSRYGVRWRCLSRQVAYVVKKAYTTVGKLRSYTGSARRASSASMY